ncbi:MAG: methionyl-tRNA formyltransferase [Methylococcales bacterium]|jgi:methionyl-tRNA formyltransferase|nr:methionyl-tRNA formyltransferase [Methylococcales bacterium]MBT7442745.1 methionyl-tRNA formyltransferase [Methylococcales bacterium]
MRILFAGTPDFSVPPLQALIDSEHEVCGVYTQPDRPSGRGRKLTASPVKAAALANNIPVFQPESLKGDEAQAELAALKPDLMVVVAYGLILPKVVLEMPTYGCFNIHASLLPRWRGAAPIQRAIMAGDAQTGVTIMQMDVGLDTGDMLHKVMCDITPSTNAQRLHDELSVMGAEALMVVIPQIEAGELKPEKQDEAFTNYAKKLDKQEATIDWSQSAQQILCQVNAFNPWPVAQTSLDNKTVRIWGAELEPASVSSAPGTIAVEKKRLLVSTSDGQLSITKLQLPNKKPADVVGYLNGHDVAGEQFS